MGSSACDRAIAVYRQLVLDRHWIVAERVGYFLDIRGLRFDPRTGVQSNNRPEQELGRADELFAAGELCLAKVLADKPDATIKYLRRTINCAIRRASQTDRLLAVPPSTRHDRIKRGELPGDLECHSWEHVFDGDTLGASAEPHWHHAEKQWTASQSSFAEWAEIIECYQVLFSLCRDDIDRQIVQARCDGGITPAVVADNFLPVHIADVAHEVGLSRRKVEQRLDDLERRYYRWFDRRIPTRRRQQRTRR